MTQSTDHQHGASAPQDGKAGDGHDSKHMRSMYLRFAAMIATAMVVMYGTMFVGTYEWDHVTFSESRVYMALTMGGTMGLIMIAWMLNMYRSTKANVGVVLASLLLLGTGVFLDRSQATVQDVGWMSSMIPHHSLAITRSERAEITDVRVCELAREISEAQRREILEMKWLINDIEENGEARTAAEAQQRQAPEFDVSAVRDCPRG